MILTTRGRYAVMAVIEIADEKTNQPVSLLTISERQKISLFYLEKIFSRLKKSGIVKSVKGPGGGYILGDDRDKITVAKIIKATGEPMKMTACATENKSCTNKRGKCKTHKIWCGLEDKIYEYLDSISLQNL